MGVLGALGALLGHVGLPLLRSLLGAAKSRVTSRPPPPPARCSESVEDRVEELHAILAQRDRDGASHVLRCLEELPKIRELLERMAQGRGRLGSTPGE